jgi:fumarate reductase subunit D
MKTYIIIVLVLCLIHAFYGFYHALKQEKFTDAFAGVIWFIMLVIFARYIIGLL